MFGHAITRGEVGTYQGEGITQLPGDGIHSAASTVGGCCFHCQWTQASQHRMPGRQRAQPVCKVLGRRAGCTPCRVRLPINHHQQRLLFRPILHPKGELPEGPDHMQSVSGLQLQLHLCVKAQVV